MTLKITDTGSLALTEAELNMMQRLLDAHDRGGFYMAYNAMTDSAEASLQGRIAIFTGPVGGVALGANRLGQWFANLDGTEGPYPGIYKQSQAFAQSALDFIEADINVSGSEGLLSDTQFFQSAQAAWDATSAAEYFPGNILNNGDTPLYYSSPAECCVTVHFTFLQFATLIILLKTGSPPSTPTPQNLSHSASPAQPF